MTVKLSVVDHVAHIELANPAKRNVLDAVASNALVACVNEAEAHSEVRCIVISAEGKSFCAGGSLDELLQAQHEGAALLNDIYAGFLAVANSSLPSVALIQGAAVGAGMNLALACDVRLVTPEAKLDTRFMQLGIHCGGGHSWMLQKFLNWEQSVAALVFGQVLSGKDIVAKGLALECVEAAQLKVRASELVAGLNGVPKALVEKTKHSLALARSESRHEKMVEHEFDVQTWSLKEPHAIEKLSAFKEMISSR